LANIVLRYIGYITELVGHLADRMSAIDAGRVPILERSSGALVGPLACRDLRQVRAHAIRHGCEHEALSRAAPPRGGRR